MLAYSHMESQQLDLPEDIEAAARNDGVLDFKDEGENESGMPIGKLTLRSSAAPVYSDGRWVTKQQARRISDAWDVELLEY
jgi:hypothetical protein